MRRTCSISAGAGWFTDVLSLGRASDTAHLVQQSSTLSRFRWPIFSRLLILEVQRHIILYDLFPATGEAFGFETLRHGF